jgi:hypothetical protein
MPHGVLFLAEVRFGAQPQCLGSIFLFSATLP